MRSKLRSAADCGVPARGRASSSPATAAIGKIRNTPIASDTPLARRNCITQPHWYSVVRINVSHVSTGHTWRYATQARPMLRSIRYAKSGIGLFSPVDSSAGVAKPPSKPSTAMNIDPRRIDSNTASAVTTASSMNVAMAGISCHNAWAA